MSLSWIHLKSQLPAPSSLQPSPGYDDHFMIGEIYFGDCDVQNITDLEPSQLHIHIHLDGVDWETLRSHHIHRHFDRGVPVIYIITVHGRRLFSISVD